MAKWLRVLISLTLNLIHASHQPQMGQAKTSQVLLAGVPGVFSSPEPKAHKVSL